MDSDTSRMTGSYLLLLSLLLHILLLLFLFIFQNSSHDGQTVEYFDPENQLQNNPLNQQQDDENTYDPDHEVLVELLAQGVQPNDTMTDDPGELPQPSQPGYEQPPIPKDAQADEETPDDAPDLNDAQESPIEENPQPAEKPEPVEEKSTPQQELLKEPLPIADTMSGPKMPTPEQKPLTPKQAVKKIVRKMVQRPTVTPAQAQMLSKLAQGFMQSMSAELGNQPSNDPTQLAHQRYMTKLWNNLKQTMNAENNVLALSDNIDTRATLVLTINKQGKLINAMLRHPRKTADINKMESMLLTNAHKVGLFPPLPASFKRDEVTFVMPIHLRAHQGIHSGYRLQVEQ